MTPEILAELQRELLVVAIFFLNILLLIGAWLLRAEAKKPLSKYVLNTAIIILNITTIEYLLQVFAITLP